MKQKIVLIILIIFAVLVGLRIFRTTGNLPINNSSSSTISVEKLQPDITLLIDNGSTVATFSAVTAETPYEALTAVAAREDIVLSVKNYDFGVFVEGIGGNINSSQKAWIYSVNGVSGTVAADKMSLKPGDSVEWRYVVPTME